MDDGRIIYKVDSLTMKDQCQTIPYSNNEIGVDSPSAYSSRARLYAGKWVKSNQGLGETSN